MIEEGTVGAVRLETTGVVNERDVIMVEHVNRMADDLAPHWPTAPFGHRSVERYSIRQGMVASFGPP
jgi:hypothetical protein